MSNFDTLVDELTEKQMEALEELAKGESLEFVRATVGITRWTWWNWTTNKPGFRERYIRVMAERAMLARLRGVENLEEVADALLALVRNASSDGVKLGAINSYLDRWGVTKLTLKTEGKASPEVLALLGVTSKSGGLDVVTDADLDAHILAAADAIRGRELEVSEE